VRSRLRTRATIAGVLAAVVGAAWLALSAALLPEPPALREIIDGAAIVGVCLFVIIGGLAIIEARALRRAELRMRNFLADVSHELRTPVAGIQASAETLLRANSSRAARENIILQILREGHRAGRLIDDLLAITRMEEGTALVSEPFDLIPLTAAAVELTKELAPTVEVRLTAPGQVRLHGDPQRIRQILDNLLSNARHATPDGGQITVHVLEHADKVQVDVTDTGPGVPPAEREHIFERFTRLNGTYPNGTTGNGLGLAIARSIATAHSGTLICADPVVTGARFRLRLPRAR
jgi:signal transduction histidine kinase